MKKKVALITGITGQDGAYLTNFLLTKGYEVHGLRRKASSINTSRLTPFLKFPQEKTSNFFLHFGDLTDQANLIQLISKIKPDEIYNLGAMSHVHTSFEEPEYSAQVDAIGTLKILEAIRILNMNNDSKIYQASTSELFGLVQETPQSEKTPFYPRSPYAIAKQYAYWISINYREAYNFFVSNGILFNHESPLRGEDFVTRKITNGIASLIFGKKEMVYLGNLDAKRDWGHAKDYVEAMWLILQQEKADDFIIATGKSHSVREFVEESFSCIGIEIAFKDKGLKEKAIIKSVNKNFLKQFIDDKQIEERFRKGKQVVAVDPYYFRPTEVESLVGDPSKANKQLGWEPKVDFKTLINEMVLSDIKLMGNSMLIEKSGYIQEIFDLNEN